MQAPPLIIGQIPFLVCAPFYAFTPEKPPVLRYFSGTPRQLNSLLEQGLVHAAPSSSFEFGKNPHLYAAHPRICTSGTLEIRSVKLFSQVPLTQLQGAQVHLTLQSDTSVALLKVLLELRYNIQVHYIHENPESAQAQLLIGDNALREQSRGQWPYSYDLGTLWQEWQGLPFVFALWIVRRDALQNPLLAPVLAQFFNQVENSIVQFRNSPEDALAHWMQGHESPLSLAEALGYFSVVDYALTDRHWESLERFFGFCAQLALLQAPGELKRF